MRLGANWKADVEASRAADRAHKEAVTAWETGREAHVDRDLIALVLERCRGANRETMQALYDAVEDASFDVEYAVPMPQREQLPHEKAAEDERKARFAAQRAAEARIRPVLVRVFDAGGAKLKRLSPIKFAKAFENHFAEADMDEAFAA